MNYDTVVIDSGGGIGETLARRLTSEAGGTRVIFLDEDDRAVARAAAAGVDARLGGLPTASALDREDVRDARVAIVASREDGRNLLVSQHLRTRHAGRVIALVNDPDNLTAFADAGVEPVCIPRTLASALEKRRREPDPLREHDYGRYVTRSSEMSAGFGDPDEANAGDEGDGRR
jgi:Trk K+ transport system NAD-binding subunit